jgi:hypothetical protein
MNRPGKTRLAVGALVLAIGFGTFWGFGLAALGSLVSTILGGDVLSDYEDIVVDSEGTPYIRVRIGGQYDNVRFRSLTGEEVELTEATTNLPTPLTAPYRSPRFFKYPIGWSERIAGINSSEKPPISWIFLRDAERPGSAVVMGYEPISNQRIGYLGRRGFRTTLPPADEQFNLGDRTLTWGGNVATTSGGISFGRLGYMYGSQAYHDERSLQPWQVFLCDENVVREINIRSRVVRSVKEFDSLVGIATVTAHVTRPKPDQEGQRPEPRLLVRCEDRLVVYNTFDNVATEFPLPEELKTERLSVSTVGEQQLMLHIHRGRWERGNVTELFTINTAGEVVEQQTVRLVWGNSQESPYFALIPACLVPVLFGWIGGIFLVAPVVQLQEWQVVTYAQGLEIAWNAAWMGLILVIMISVILTTIIYHWQKKYSRPNTGLWTTFVFLTTLPGFLAYWVMHRREPMGVCVQCGRSVPQDRDICAKCAMPLPEPKLLGTEIFA